jgi:hypothetical protein
LARHLLTLSSASTRRFWCDGSEFRSQWRIESNGPESHAVTLAGRHRLVQGTQRRELERLRLRHRTQHHDQAPYFPIEPGRFYVCGYGASPAPTHTGADLTSAGSAQVLHKARSSRASTPSSWANSEPATTPTDNELNKRSGLRSSRCHFGFQLHTAANPMRRSSTPTRSQTTTTRLLAPSQSGVDYPRELVRLRDGSQGRHRHPERHPRRL